MIINTLQLTHPSNNYSSSNIHSYIRITKTICSYTLTTINILIHILSYSNHIMDPLVMVMVMAQVMAQVMVIIMVLIQLRLGNRKRNLSMGDQGQDKTEYIQIYIGNILLQALYSDSNYNLCMCCLQNMLNSWQDKVHNNKNAS